MTKVIPQSFFDRSALKVAQDLLGCFLVRDFMPEKIIIRAKIVETEAYNGPKDLACHSAKGCTPRTQVLFGDPGYFYVYFTYGMHYMLNVVTGPGKFPSAVLIRALEPMLSKSNQIANHKSLITLNGPAKLTKSLAIDKSFNTKPAFTKESGLWIEQSASPIPASKIVKAKRIGVDYAGIYKEKLWRFYIKDNKFISKK